MIECPTVERRVIRGHYDLSTLFYRLFWGPHIHHGLWDRPDSGESPARAQVQLTEALADRAAIGRGAALVDIGCGMGGSAIHLARRRGCRATGVTISPVQRRWAAASARWQGVGNRCEFVLADAERVELPAAAFDVVWSVECTEHLFNKPAFFCRAAEWLRPGGRMAICAWLAGREATDPARQRQVVEVCEGFFCPSLGTLDDYRRWMTDAGLRVDVAEDWTERVARTWEICRRRIDRSGVRWLARAIDRDTALFLDRFETILGAYRSGAMQYGCLVATRAESAAPPATLPGA